MIENNGAWEKRWHPLRREWVVYAPHRNKRPWSFDLSDGAIEDPVHDENCYLCPGNKRNQGDTNPNYTDVFIFNNDYPVVSLLALEEKKELPSIYQTQAAYGQAKVICYTPNHNKTIADLNISAIQKIMEVWKRETLKQKQNPKIQSVLIFENRGELVGVSNPHPHCQLYATDFVFKFFREEMDASAMYASQNNGKNLFDDIVEQEIKDEIRIISENERAIAFVPFFARYAYEILIFPKTKAATLCDLEIPDLAALAQIYREVVRRYDLLYKQRFPYVMNIHQAPLADSGNRNYQMYFHFQPPLRKPGLVKFLAGPEIGGGNFMADTLPELKAAELKSIDLNLYDQVFKMS